MSAAFKPCCSIAHWIFFVWSADFLGIFHVPGAARWKYNFSCYAHIYTLYCMYIRSMQSELKNIDHMPLRQKSPFFPKISLLQVESIFCCSGAFSRFRHYHLPKLLFVIYRCCSLCFRRNRVIFNRIHHRTRMHFASRFSVFHMTAIHFPHVIYHLYIVMCVLRHLYFDFFANRNYSSSHDCDMIELWNFVFNIFMVPLLYPPY